jgi:hypothetical protein
MTTVFFAVLPIGEYLVWAWLLISAELAVVLTIGRTYREDSADIPPETDDLSILRLLRRVVPDLRARRPPVVIEAQRRWRLAAAPRRRLHSAY